MQACATLDGTNLSGAEGDGAMWHLIEDFFEQGLVVKLFLGVGWLAVVIMVASFVSLILP